MAAVPISSFGLNWSSFFTRAEPNVVPQKAVSKWLYSPRWDIWFLIASAVIAIIPYSLYLLLGGSLVEAADQIGTSAYNARLAVNTLVLVLIGGPHMYATFTRTMMDPVTFKRKKWLYISTSILVPAFVFSFAIFSYDTYVWLMTIFFGMASLHALQQIMWICGAYDIKGNRAVSWFDRFIDYGVIFASLYPVPIWLMIQRSFYIGPVPLKINDIVGGWWLLGVAVTLFFALMVVLFIWKTFREWYYGELHYGKTLLITATVLLMNVMMFLPNLDTAAQGINSWHSFQYLALTWFAHKVAQQKKGIEHGFMYFWRDLYTKAKAMSASKWGVAKNFAVEFTRAMRAIDKDSGWSSFYLVTISMLPITGVIAIAAGTILPQLHAGRPGADEVYTYMGILSILLVHYVHDAFLYTDAEDLVLATS